VLFGAIWSYGAEKSVFEACQGGTPRPDYGRGASAKTVNRTCTCIERHEALETGSDLPMDASAAV
jgi:hypothetical protein